MQHVRRILLLAASITILLPWLCFFWGFSTVSATSSPVHIDSLAPIASPTATSTSASKSPQSSSIDPAIIAAFIALIGVLITAGISLYLFRRTRQLEREKILLQDEVAAKRATKVKEQEHKEKEDEAAQSAMLRAKTTAERVQAYREALRADPRIARLQILDMNRPLTVTDIYIRVRLHQETRPGYELDPILLDAEAHHDPNELLKAGRLRLESRASAALEPHEAIRTYRHCVIVGDPGAGKTTLLKYLVLQSVDQQLPDLPDLPVHVELNAFANSGHRDLLEFASSVWEERYSFPKADALAYIQNNLKNGRALLLLDALDETVAGTTKEDAEESYKRATKAISDLATRYHQAPVIVTARKAGYYQRTRLGGFTELEVLDFRPEDITQFVNRWFACHPNPQKRANAADLNTRLERNPRISALAANPLLLSLIVIVYEDQLDLPDRRAELYRQCVETLLTKWDASRNIRRRREFKPEHKRQLLEQVAWHFHQQGQRYFPENELLAVIAAFLPTVGLPAEQNGLVLDEVAAENGLLKEQARGWHGFLHLTLQEYFAAQYAVDHQELDTLLDHRGDPWWEEVLSLYAGRTPDASPLLELLLEPGNEQRFREDLFQTNLLVAGECLAAKPTVKRASLRALVITRLLESFVKAPYALTRQQLSKVLGKLSGGEVNSYLLRLLVDKQVDKEVRVDIAEVLGELGERSVIPDLLRLLADEQADDFVRYHITQALGELGERSVIPDLLRLLADEQVEYLVRLGIARTLGELGERSIIPDLLRLLTNSQVEQYLRAKIAEALGELGERSIIPDLLRLLTDEQVDKQVRLGIAITLGELGERSIIPDLLRLLADEQVEYLVRSGIARTLGELGERSIIPDLLRLLADEQVEYLVRLGIAITLGELGERSVIPDLLRLLADEQVDKQVRSGIATTLGELGERSIIPDLLRLLADEQMDKQVRSGIARTLGELGERSVIPDLLRLLADEQVDKQVRSGIARTLGELGERSIIPDLLRLLVDKQVDKQVRQRLADAVGTLANDEVTVRALAALLPTSDITDAIYRALWTVSRRTGVRIFTSDGPAGKQLEIVKW
jgi:HEAT repeat protein/GTPase SAR1 family protein